MGQQSSAEAQGLILCYSSRLRRLEENSGQEPIPLRLGDLPDPSRLQLCKKRITTIDPQIGLLGAIPKSAFLCCNLLTSIPEEFGYLTRITSLSLERNHLQTLPESIGMLKQLTVLKVNRNEMTRLPESLFTLTQLKVLNIAHNRLFQLSHSLGNMQGLVHLDVSFNPLSVLPAEISMLPQLRRFYTDECPFSVVLPTTRVPKTPMTLRELSLRVYLRQNLYHLHTEDGQSTAHIPKLIQSKLESAHLCLFCGGPWVETHVRQYRWWKKGESEYPIVERLCCQHYVDGLDRTFQLFGPLPSTALQPPKQRDEKKERLGARAMEHVGWIRQDRWLMKRQFGLVKREPVVIPELTREPVKKHIRWLFTKAGMRKIRQYTIRKQK
jgi:hypothetical protein